MTHRLLFSVALLALSGCVGTPHRSPSEITTPEISAYKLGIKTGCKDAGKNKGDPESKVSAFCDCVGTTLQARMTVEEWQRATYFAQQRKDQDEQSVLAPHMRSINSCKQ